MSQNIAVIEVQERPAALVRGHVRPEGIGGFLGHAFQEVAALAARQGASIVGPPLARYQPTEDQGFDVEAGFPVDHALTSEGEVEASVVPGGTAARVLHVGPYSEIGPVYEAVEQWLAENGYVAAGAPWESYLDGPEVAAPRTEVLFPCMARADA